MPTDFPFPPSRMARPTAWTMSTVEYLGAINVIASNAGTSIPSVQHLACETIKVLSLETSANLLRVLTLSEVG